METNERIETSASPLELWVNENELNIFSPGKGYPRIHASICYVLGHWELTDQLIYQIAEDEFVEANPALTEEITKLGIAWCETHEDRFVLPKQLLARLVEGVWRAMESEGICESYLGHQYTTQKALVEEFITQIWEYTVRPVDRAAFRRELKGEK